MKNNVAPFLFYLLGVMAFTPFFADAYPRYRYYVTPLARMHELEGLPPIAHSIHAPDTVSVHLQVENYPGNTTSYWLFNSSFEEYQAMLKARPFADEGEAADRVRELVKILKKNDFKSVEEMMPVAKELQERIGMIRTSYILESAEHFPVESLYAMAGVTDKNATPEQVLVLRRFGVMRRRGPIETGHRGQKPIEYFMQPLVPDRYAHLVVGDIVTPFTAHYIPTPVQFYPEIKMSEFFDADHKSLLVSWGVNADEVIDLSFKAYIDQMEHDGVSVAPEQIEAQKNVTRSLDLSRLFFYVIEDFTGELPLQTISFIDGGKTGDDFYETPAEKRHKDIKFRELFPNDYLIEIRGLAIDPELRGKKGSPINTEAWAAQLLDFVHNGGHDNTRFILQARSGAARLYESKFGFVALNKIPGEKDPMKILAMHTTGAELKARIYKLFPHLKVGFAMDFPNRLNRRMPDYNTDKACMAKLRNFGY